ncbi:MAG TPA: hypothetical protein VLH15_01380, partial [Dehalococcoidales bacterium]|nr:hypothetical protein [Dehalococcoidales bacterium]
YARCKVTVHLGLDHSLAVFYQGNRLQTKPILVEPTASRSLLNPVLTKTTITRIPFKPSPDHPWRRTIRV